MMYFAANLTCRSVRVPVLVLPQITQITQIRTD